MVAPIPNRTSLVGRVAARRPHGSAARQDLLALEIVSSAAVAGEPDLLHPAPGQRLEVAVDRDWLPPDVAPGSTVQLDATVAGPDVVRAVWRSDGPAVRVVS